MSGNARACFQAKSAQKRGEMRSIFLVRVSTCAVLVERRARARMRYDALTFVSVACGRPRSQGAEESNLR